MDLTSLSQLRSITFIVCFGVSVGRRRWITQILSHLSAAHLEDVVFITHVSHVEGNDSEEISNALEWQHVDAIVQRTVFSRLRTVRFFVGSTSDESRLFSARTSIMQHLPQCHARGILRFEQDPPL
jgi:hypothetical protein